MEYGLLSVTELKRKGLKAHTNDFKRLDGRENKISCSVSIPNHYTLQDFNRKNQSEWILVEIDPMVCVYKDCEFFYTNAANSVFGSDEFRWNTPEDFSELFRNPIEYPISYGTRTLWRKGKPKDEPTCVQAEVMIRKKISKKYLGKWQPLNVG